MTYEMIVTAIVLTCVIILFLTDRISIALVSMSAALALGLTGVVSPAAVFRPLSNSAVILVLTMTTIGHALFHTGVAQIMAQKFIKYTGTTEKGIMVAIVLIALIFSSIASGTAVVAIMLPLVISICKETQNSLSRQLIPLSFAASMGGNLTLVGAASNLVVAGVYEERGLPFLSFFDIGKVGFALSIAFLAYFLLIGKHLLRKGDTSDKEYIAEMTGSGEKIEINRSKATITVAVLILVIIAMAANIKWLPMYFAAALGVLILRLTGVFDAKSLLKSIDLTTMFIMTGTLVLGTAVHSSGLGKYVADYSVNLLGDNPSKLVVLAVIMVVTTLLTNFMTNTGTAALMPPIFIPIAQLLDMNLIAVGVAICISAASPFITPYGSATNFMLIKPGRLNMRDFFVPGIGLTVITIVISLLLIPVFWPL